MRGLLLVAGLVLLGFLAVEGVDLLEGAADVLPSPSPVVCVIADGRLFLFPGGEPRDPHGPCASAVLLEEPF